MHPVCRPQTVREKESRQRQENERHRGIGEENEEAEGGRTRKRRISGTILSCWLIPILCLPSKGVAPCTFTDSPWRATIWLWVKTNGTILRQVHHPKSCCAQSEMSQGFGNEPRNSLKGSHAKMIYRGHSLIPCLSNQQEEDDHVDPQIRGWYLRRPSRRDLQNGSPGPASTNTNTWSAKLKSNGDPMVRACVCLTKGETKSTT